MTKALIGERFQVVIPKRERELLGLKPRSSVDITVGGGCAVVRPLGRQGWRGIGRELATGKRPADYVRELREEWGKRA